MALSEELNTTSEDLKTLLYKIPNLPNAIVPVGTTEDDNEEVFRAGTIPTLSEKCSAALGVGQKI